MGVNGIYGLSGSGMDIESMVKVGMMGKQNEYDKMAQKYTKNEWMKAEYLELSNQINTFNLSTLDQYKKTANMNAKEAESTSTAIKISANSSASNVTHRVNVTELSYNARLISTGTIARVNQNATSSDSIYLKDILFKTLNDSSTGKVSGTTLNEVKADGTDDGGSKNFSNVKLDDKAISFFISDGVTTEANGDIKKVEISFKFYDVIKGNASLNDLASKISQAGLNIKAFYDYDSGQFSIYNTKNGPENTIEITTGENYDSDNISGRRVYAGRVAANFLNELQLYQFKDGELYDPSTLGDDNSSNDKTNAMYFSAPNETVTTKGGDGKINVDGATYKLVDNKATVDGVTYTALNKTSEPAVVSISQDTDEIVDKVKSFVADYNKLLSSLYEKYDEKPNSDYKPLTQSQRDSMKEEQITKWEEKAKAGLLYHDQTLGKIIQNLRSAISDSIELDDGSTVSIFSLGISTTGLKGQLQLDEDKLKAALDKNPNIVSDVFTHLDKNDLDNYAASGVAQRLGDVFVNATKSIKSRAGSSADITEDSDLNNLLRQLQTRMSNFKKLMNSFETALYKKYDAMEATLAKLGTQLSFIMGGNS